MSRARGLLLGLAACTAPAPPPGGGADTAEDRAPDTAAEAALPEWTVVPNPDNPFAAIATLTLPAAADVHLEYGTGGAFDRSTPTVAVPAGTPTRLQVLGLVADTEWSIRAVVDPVGPAWTSEPLSLRTPPLAEGWPACTTELSVAATEYTPDEVVCANLTLDSGAHVYACWDRAGTPVHALRSPDDHDLNAMRPLPAGGWASTSATTAHLLAFDNFGAQVRAWSADELGPTRFVHDWIDGHELLPLTDGEWAGAVAMLTVTTETLPDGGLRRGNGIVVFDPAREAVLYDYSFHGVLGDGEPADPRLPYSRVRDPDPTDWQHANALAWTRDPDGRPYFLVALRNQDWIVKLYPDDDSLAWRLGWGGDFTLVDELDAAEPQPLTVTAWAFQSHGLAIQSAPDERLRFLVFDNGIPRYDEAGVETPGFSRVAEFEVDEAARRVDTPFAYGEALAPQQRMAARDRGNALRLPGDRVLFLLGDQRELREVSYPEGVLRWTARFAPGDTGMDRVAWFASLYDTGWTDAAPAAPTTRALLARDGVATVGADLTGVEALVLRDAGGLGAEQCRIESTLRGAAPRTDCAVCAWAWDVHVEGAQRVLDEGCARAGLDGDALPADTVRGYGLAEDYLGHAHTLLVDEGEGWTPVAFVDWDPASGALRYRWELGTVE